METIVGNLWDIDEVRYRLLEHMVKMECGALVMSKRIGIAFNTLRNFLTKKKEPTFRTLSRIINYLKKYDKPPVIVVSDDNGIA